MDKKKGYAKTQMQISSAEYEVRPTGLRFETRPELTFDIELGLVKLNLSLFFAQFFHKVFILEKKEFMSQRGQLKAYSLHVSWDKHQV